LAPGSELGSRIDLLLGECYRHLGNVEQELACFRQAARADSRSPAALLNLAQAERSAGHLDAAIEAYRPGAATMPAARLAVARRQGHAAGGLALLREARLRLGDRADLRLALAEHLAQTPGPQSRKALGELEQGIDKFTGSEQVVLLRALAAARRREEPQEAT